jgi:hypothetical protein
MGRWPLLAVSLVAGLLAGTAQPSSRSTAADASLVGRWHLDEIDGANGIAIATTPDSSGNGLVARVSAAGLVAGKFDNAFGLTSGNAAPSGAEVAANPVLAPQSLTVLAWVKRGGSPGQYVYVAAKGAHDCSAASYGLYTGAAGGLVFYVSLGQSVALSPDAGQRVWDGNWHAVAGTYDGQSVRLYVDGTEVGGGTPATGSIAYQNEDVSHDFTIGFYPGGANCTAQYSGLVDEVEVYNRALQQNELSWLATGNGSGPPELPPPAPPTTTLQTTTTQATTTTQTTTAQTTTATTTTAPPSSTLQTHIVAAPSRTLPGGMWFDAAVAKPAGDGPIAKIAWDTNGDGTYDLPCGLGTNRGIDSSAASIAFAKPGAHTVGVQVTDSAGNVATSTMTVRVSAREATNASALIGNVVDCENPGANNQPDRADCVKTYSFGIIEVNSRGRPTDCFTITSRTLASKVTARRLQGVPGKNKNVVRVYHAEIDGPVAINGLYVAVPEDQHSAYDTFDYTIGIGDHQTVFGKYRTLPVKLDLAIDPDNNGYFKIADVSLNGAIPSIGGLQPDAGVTLGFVNHRTQIDFHLKLPSIFTFGSGVAEATGTFSLSNEDGLVFDGGQLNAPDVFIGPVDVHGLHLEYSETKTGHAVWNGGATVQLFTDGLALDANQPPADKGFGLIDGRFDHAGIGVKFPEEAQPQLFPGLFVTHIDITLGTHPLRFSGFAGLSAAHVMDMDGEVFVVFASNGEPYVFPDQSGDLQPLAGRSVSSFAIAVGGTGSLDVPVIGSIPLLDGYLLYEAPSFFEIKGGFDVKIGFLHVNGGVHGFVDGGSGKWDYDMGVSACLDSIEIWGVSLDGICLNVGGVISSKGLGFCGVVPVPTPFGPVPVDVGVGYSWGDSFPDLMIFDCDYGPWKESVPGARALQAGGTTVTLSGGPAAMIRVVGTGGVPDVTLTGPGGKTISTKSPAVDKSIAVVKIADADETLIAFRNPARGRWTVTPAGSVPIKSIATSAGLVSPRISAHVAGAGSTRTLVYAVANAAGATVTFAERGGGAYRVLGTANAAKGSLRFTPVPGPGGKREIVAELARNGAPLRNVVVASYAAPVPARLPRPHPRVARRNGTLMVTWHPVRGAAAYSVTLMSRGARTMSVVKGTTARFSGFGTAGRAVVGALGATGAHGPLASVPFKAAPRRARKPRKR